MKIIADNKIPFLQGVLEPFSEILYLKGNQITSKDLEKADVLITRTITPCNATLLENSTVQLITSATIGYDHIDTQYCQEKNITWTNAAGCNSNSVVQYVLSAILQLAVDKNFSLVGKTLGIVGVGNVGSKVVKAAQILGMNVLLNDPPRQEKEHDLSFVSLEQICKQSDIITFHVPLLKDGEHKTYHLVDEKFIASLPNTTYLINTSRGAVIDNQILKKALQNQQIAGAILDVWENEPCLDTELLTLVNYGTPHIAGYSADGKANGTAMTVHTISKKFNLPLENWYPQVPIPENTLINVDCATKSYEQILLEVISTTYNILRDDNLLRQSPQTFENQRSNYYLRREFPTYTVKVHSDTMNLCNVLSNLGFTISQD